MWRARVQDLINMNPIKSPYLHQSRHYSKVIALSSSTKLHQIFMRRTTLAAHVNSMLCAHIEGVTSGEVRN